MPTIFERAFPLRGVERDHKNVISGPCREMWMPGLCGHYPRDGEVTDKWWNWLSEVSYTVWNQEQTVSERERKTLIFFWNVFGTKHQ